MNDLQQQIKEALEKATPGKWHSEQGEHNFNIIVSIEGSLMTAIASRVSNEDANFLSNAPTWLQQLLDELDRQHDEFYNEVRIREQEIGELKRKEAKDVDVITQYALENAAMREEIKKLREIQRCLVLSNLPREDPT